MNVDCTVISLTWQSTVYMHSSLEMVSMGSINCTQDICMETHNVKPQATAYTAITCIVGQSL